MLIILMGVIGSGKSTIGLLVARQLGADFLEGDDYHSNANVEKIRQGTPLSDEDRKPWLEKLAAAIEIRRAAERHVVVACSALKASYRELLIGNRKDTHIVYLKGGESLIRSRLKSRKHHFANPKILLSQFEVLEEPTIAITIDIEEVPEVIAAAICASLATQSDKTSIRCIWNGRAQLGESPLWDFREKCLYWVDIKGKTIHRYRPANETTETIPVPEEIGCVALREAGGLVAATRSGFAFLDPDKGLFRVIATPEQDQPGNRFNDGKCDRLGRFWAGTMDDAVERTTGALYRLSPDLAVSRMLTGVTIPNGIGWSPDNRTMYFTDSAQQTISAFDFEEKSGDIFNPRIFASIAVADGVPDGLTVDAEGYIWSAHWDGWRVTRYTPEGEVDRVIMLPVPRPTSCAFGGELLDRLYITSASIGLPPEQLARVPLSGGVFELDVGVSGCREPRFPR